MKRFQLFKSNNKLDYEKLHSAKEGWFVEFKEKFNDSSKASKSITSFLNSYGGYIIIGVIEKKDKSEAFHEFKGLTTEETKKQITLIKDTIKRNISPTPFVEIFPITGPIPELQLESGKELIIIDIPEGNNPPYISQSSKIYRRKHDSSEPEEENNRYVIDELYKKSKELEYKIQREIQSFNYTNILENRYPLSSLNVYYFPEQYPNIINHKVLKIENLEPLINKFNNEFLRFDNIYYEGTNIVFRSMFGSPNYNLSGLIVSFNRENYSFKIRIHCSESFIDSNNIDDLNIFKNDYKYINEFKELFKNEIFNSVGVVDFSEVLKKVYISFLFYRRILKFLKYTNDLKCKVTLSNIQKKIPYLDYKNYIEHCKKYKLPYYLSENLEYPEENSINSLINISLSETPDLGTEDENVHERANAIISSIPLTLKIFDLLSFGIPPTEDITSFYF